MPRSALFHLLADHDAEDPDVLEGKVRALLSKDPEFITGICGQAVEDLRVEVAEEIAEWLPSVPHHSNPAEDQIIEYLANSIRRAFGEDQIINGRGTDG